MVPRYHHSGPMRLFSRNSGTKVYLGPDLHTSLRLQALEAFKSVQNFVRLQKVLVLSFFVKASNKAKVNLRFHFGRLSVQNLRASWALGRVWADSDLAGGVGGEGSGVGRGCSKLWVLFPGTLCCFLRIPNVQSI